MTNPADIARSLTALIAVIAIVLLTSLMWAAFCYWAIKPEKRDLIYYGVPFACLLAANIRGVLRDRKHLEGSDG